MFVNFCVVAMITGVLLCGWGREYSYATVCGWDEITGLVLFEVL